MFKYDRLDASKGIGVNKTESIICHYWHLI